MATEDLTLRMRASGARAAARDVDRATGSVRKLDRTTDKTGRSMKRTSGSVRLFSSGLRPMVRVATSAGAALGALGLAGAAKMAVGEFRESRKVTRTTEAHIRSMGASSWVTSKKVGDLANSISLNTGMDDELIQTGSNLLLTFGKIRNETGKGSNMFDRATQAAVDLSASGFGSVDSAAKQLGKALNDPIKGITALNRSGVTFTEGQKKQIKALTESGKVLQAQKIIMAEVEKQVGGTAKAQADPLDKLQVSWANLMETLGGHLFPLLSKGADAMSKFVGEMQSGTGQGGKFVDTAKNIWAEVKPVVQWIGKAVVAVGRFGAKHPELVKIAGGIVAVGVALKTLKFVSAATGFTGLLKAGRTAAGGLKRIFATAGTEAGAAVATNTAASTASGMGPALNAKKAGITGKFRTLGRSAGRAFGLAAAVMIAAEVGNALAKNSRHGSTSKEYGGGFLGSALSTLNNIGTAPLNLGEKILGVRPKREAPRRKSVVSGGGPNGTGRLAVSGGGPNGTGDIVIHNTTHLDGKVVAQSTHRQAVRKRATR